MFANKLVLFSFPLASFNNSSSVIRFQIKGAENSIKTITMNKHTMNSTNGLCIFVFLMSHFWQKVTLKILGKGKLKHSQSFFISCYWGQTICAKLSDARREGSTRNAKATNSQGSHPQLTQSLSICIQYLIGKQQLHK